MIFSTTWNDRPGHDAFFQPFNFVTGLMVFDSYLDDRMTAALSFARVGKQTVRPFAFGAGPGEYAATGRLTALPIYEEEGQRLMHLGIAYSYSGIDDHNFDTANRPLVRAGAGSQEVPDIVQSGPFFTPDPVQILNAELAAVFGRLSLSANTSLRGPPMYSSSSTDGTFSGPHGNVTYQGAVRRDWILPESG